MRLTEIPAPPFQEAPARGRLQNSSRLRRPERSGRCHRQRDRRAARRERKRNRRALRASRHRLSGGHGRQSSPRRRAACSRPEFPTTARASPRSSAIARAIHEAQIKPQRTILFVADVGEEGEGNLRGMRALVDAYHSRLKAVIVLDGAGTDHVTTNALASRRLEVVITGPGGHSWSDFGMPNPINALVRGSVRFINTKVPASPRTTFNLGQIEGGTSVNSIPYEARLKSTSAPKAKSELARSRVRSARMHRRRRSRRNGILARSFEGQARMEGRTARQPARWRIGSRVAASRRVARGG